MKFDSNLAWSQASATVSANRDLVLALGGVFFLLPQLVLAEFMPDPPASAPGASPQETLAAMQGFYRQILPLVLPLALWQMWGTLGILTLFTDAARPTVGEALKAGARGILPLLGAEFLFAFGAVLISGTALGAAQVSGSKGAVAGMALALILGLGAVAVRISVVSPVVAVERIYNPLRALRRAWALTRGNGLRIFVFLALLLLVAGVVMLATSAGVSAVVALISGKATAQIVSGVVSAFVSAAVSLYFIAILAAVHRQLAGPSAAADSGFPF